MLPFTVLRRMDQVLAPTKAAVLAENARLEQAGVNPDGRYTRLCQIAGVAFYNVSGYDFDRLTGDSASIETNLPFYIDGFSKNVRELLEKFNFHNTVEKLVEADLLFK